MIECSVCQTSINKTYCPKCGQRYVEGKLTWKALIGDAMTNFFSLESRLVNTLKLAFLDPKKLLDNYLGGFKNFYFSPGRLFLLASVFFGFTLLFENKRFFVLSFGDNANALEQFIVFIHVFVFLSLSSFAVYYKKKKSILEHLVINLYAVSTWLFFFSIVSIVYKLFDISLFGGDIELLICVLLHSYWVARMLDNRVGKQILYAILTMLLFLAISVSYIYILTGGKWSIEA